MQFGYIIVYCSPNGAFYHSYSISSMFEIRVRAAHFHVLTVDVLIADCVMFSLSKRLFRLPHQLHSHTMSRFSLICHVCFFITGGMIIQMIKGSLNSKLVSRCADSVEI